MQSINSTEPRSFSAHEETVCSWMAQITRFIPPRDITVIMFHLVIRTHCGSQQPVFSHLPFTQSQFRQPLIGFDAAGTINLILKAHK